MAKDTIVTGSKLTAIANAIRAKGGTSAQLTLDQMPQAVDDLPTGGGGFDTSQLTGMIKFYGPSGYSYYSIDVAGLDLSNMTMANGMFSDMTRLTSLVNSHQLNAPRAGNMTAMFGNCQYLTSLDLGGLDTSGTGSFVRMFDGCTRLASLNLANISMARVRDTNSMFQGCSALTDIIWATKRQTVVALPTDPSNMNITSTMQFYVPDALLSEYQSATNWATIASQIHSINDLPASVAALYAGHY